MNKPTVLVIEDDSNIQEMLKVILQQYNFRPVFVKRGTDAIKKVRNVNFDMILLDLNLPDITGWDVLRFIKKDEDLATTPIIIITGEYKRSIDMVKALDDGADDYLIKPFSLKILVARMKAIMRRTNNGSRKFTRVVSDENEKISINLDAHEVYIKLPDGTTKVIKDLTAKEFDLLACFLKYEKRVLSRQFIYEFVWNLDYYGTSRTVDKHVERLRAKLGEYGKFIKTLPKIGYQFNTEEE